MKDFLNYLGIKTTEKVYRNVTSSKLIEEAIKREEGVLSDKGALVINTGKYTGRSPKDRFIVTSKDVLDKINWGDINLPIEEEKFNRLYNQVIEYLNSKDLFVFDGFAGALKEQRVSFRVVCEKASQAMFANNLLIRGTREELQNYKAEFTIISAPDFKAKGSLDGINSEAFVIINFEKKIILIGGTGYCGEIKKSVFSVMNYLLPLKGIFPMHCSANIGEDSKTAVFFGLSGTGKTTLSADKDRRLIGDDEHGWGSDGIFNFEGGCYAKTIKLSKENEKEIYEAIKFGTVLENVILDENGVPNYDDGTLTENTRAGYPIDFIENAELKGQGEVPSTIIFLTADAFGVIPPISKLSKEAAMYHFMSGYTSKVAGTERGIIEPVATFSACFGEPFMLMNPSVYAKLLGQKIEESNTEVYLINTGWLSGGYGKGSRVKLKYTRAMVKAAINGELKNLELEYNERFNVYIPKAIKDVPSEILDPKNTWEDKEAYEEKAKLLVQKFHENFKKFKEVPEEIKNAGPRF